MSDLISRADAIEAVGEWGTSEERIGTLTMPMVSIKQTVTDILSALPSADAVSREVYEKRANADESIIDSYRKEFVKAASAEPIAEEVWSVAQKVFHSTLTYREAVDYLKELEKQHERFNQQNRSDRGGA